MSSRLFLYNLTVFALEAAEDPRLDPDFPLSKPQYDELTLDALMQLLREEIHVDPDILNHNPKRVRILCSLLLSRAGINCVKVHWDGYGVSSRHGTVPEQSLIELRQAAAGAALTDEIVEKTIWSGLQIV